MAKVSNYSRKRIEILYKQGLHPAEILRALKWEGLWASFSSITRIIKRLRLTGSVANLPWSGRPQKLSMDAKTFVDHQMHRDDKTTSNMYLSRNYCIFQFTFIVIHRSSQESNMMLFGSLTFCLLCLVSNMKCLRPCDWKKAGNMFICIFRVAYMNSKQTQSFAAVYCQFEAKFQTPMIEKTFSAVNFRFMAKIKLKSILCSNKMLPKRPQTFNWIFALENFRWNIMRTNNGIRRTLHNTVSLISLILVKMIYQ